MLGFASLVEALLLTSRGSLKAGRPKSIYSVLLLSRSHVKLTDQDDRVSEAFVYVQTAPMHAGAPINSVPEKTEFQARP
jgi:hypothetical protein